MKVLTASWSKCMLITDQKTKGRILLTVLPIYRWKETVAIFQTPLMFHQQCTLMYKCQNLALPFMFIDILVYAFCSSHQTIPTWLLQLYLGLVFIYIVSWLVTINVVLIFTSGALTLTAWCAQHRHNFCRLLLASSQ